MQNTSHFVWIEIKPELLSDVFISVYKYLKENNIESIIKFQNPLSVHITLYYFEKDLSENDKCIIKDEIRKSNFEKDIFIDWLNYFMNWDKYIFYLNLKTDLHLKWFRDNFHTLFNRSNIEDNNYDFVPHITLFSIEKKDIFEKHRLNIENLINKELIKINELNLSNKKCFLYAVNSKFKEEIQIKL